MFTTSYINGFGHSFGAAPSLLTLVEQARAIERQRNRSGLGRDLGRVVVRRGLGGFGAAFTGSFIDFNNGKASPATFVGGTNSPNAVFCSKEANTFRVDCVLNQAGGGKAQIQTMQSAIDRVMNLIPTNNLAGRQFKGQLPTGDGTTSSEQTFTVPANIQSPIATTGGGGIDGVVGDTTTKFGVLALTLAGMLKAFPNPGVAAAFVATTRNDVWAEFSSEIGTYLNDVADNFQELLDAFTARGDVPIQTQLDVSTIPFLVPIEGPKSNKKAIIGISAAMIGITAVAAVAAGKHKPTALYDERPALGRGRGRRGRVAPRGW